MVHLDAPVPRRVFDAAFKHSAAALRDANIAFALMGSLALWARGGPDPTLEQDLDYAIREQDVVPAAQALHAAGLRLEVPDEDWLFKAWYKPGDEPEVLADLIYAPSGLQVTTELLQDAEIMQVIALEVPVLSATDLLVTKLCSIAEQTLDYSSAMTFARSLREQIDWERLRERTKDSMFAGAFFTICQDLGLYPPRAVEGAPGNAASSDRLAQHPHRGQLIDYVRSVQGGRVPSPVDPESNVANSTEGAETERAPAEYVVARVIEAIAQDPAVNELNIDVSIHDDTIVLEGCVQNQERRSRIPQVVLQVAPGYEIDDRLQVSRISESDEVEELS